MANTQTQSQKQDSAVGTDSIGSTSSLGQDHTELLALVQQTCIKTLHLQMYMSLQCTNLRLVGGYLLGFAHKEKGKL